MRLLYSNNGFTFRDATPAAIDERDAAAGFTGLPAQEIAAEEGEVEFDHLPTDEELAAAFPGRAAALAAAARAQAAAPILAELAELDRFLPRAVEDSWAASGFDTSSLPAAQRDRLAKKQSLRAALAAL